MINGDDSNSVKLQVLSSVLYYFRLFWQRLIQLILFDSFVCDSAHEFLISLFEPLFSSMN